MDPILECVGSSRHNQQAYQLWQRRAHARLSRKSLISQELVIPSLHDPQHRSNNVPVVSAHLLLMEPESHRFQRQSSPMRQPRRLSGPRLVLRVSLRYKTRTPTYQLCGTSATGPHLRQTTQRLQNYSPKRPRSTSQNKMILGVMINGVGHPNLFGGMNLQFPRVGLRGRLRDRPFCLN